jgi:hypothetical protein
MAATIARAFGFNESSCTDASRLGTVRAAAEANTRNTFTTAKVNADGSGEIMIERTGRITGKRFPVLTVKFGAEDEPGYYVARISGEGTIVNDGARIAEVSHA